MCSIETALVTSTRYGGTRDQETDLLAFDVLELNGEDGRGRPLRERKRRLAKLLTRARDRLSYVEDLTGDAGTNLRTYLSSWAGRHRVKARGRPYQSDARGHGAS